MSFFGMGEPFSGVDDMLLVDNEGPSEVRSVNLELWAGCEDRGALPLRPCNAPGPLLPDHETVVSIRGVRCS